jgi:flagella basal body P-ring formation protein FlgA
MNGRPLSTRKKIQILVAFTILAWATHTLLTQWAHGAEIFGEPAAIPGPPPGRMEAPNTPAEIFVPGKYAAPGTLELRGETSVYGRDVRLRQVCRWSEADAAMFVPVSDLVVLHMDDRTYFKPIGLDDLRTALHEAGVNMGNLRFSGPTLCTVRRSDAQGTDTSLTMEQWIQARRGATAEPPPVPVPGRAIAMPVALSVTSDPVVTAAVQPATRPAAVVSTPSPGRSLRSALLNDLSIRVGIPVEQLVVSFNPSNERVLNLSEPMFRFNLDARRVRNLGEVEWEVTLVASGGERKVPIVATARAWQSQVTVNKPLSYHQLIRPEDLSEHKALIDRVSDEPLLSMDQCVGEQAARDLKPDTILTARMVDPVPLAKPGQLITINANQGNIHIRTVARALEGGSFGQTIRVKNDVTNDTYDVVLTGPQEGLIGTPGDAARQMARRN